MLRSFPAGVDYLFTRGARRWGAGSSCL